MLAVKQDERFTINFRDASERTPKNGIFLIGDGLVGREWFRTHGFIHCFHQLGCVRWLPALSSKLVGDPKANDSAQPRPQLCRLPEGLGLWSCFLWRNTQVSRSGFDTAQQSVGMRPDFHPDI